MGQAGSAGRSPLTLNLSKEGGVIAEISDPFLVEDFGYDLEPEDTRAGYHAIEERLYLGNVVVAHSEEFIKENGITHVVNCLGPRAEPFKAGGKVQYFTIDVDDTINEDIIAHFRPACDFMSAALTSNATNRVFVHCAAGVSRSSTLLIAFIMDRDKIPAGEAYARVRRVRRMANPNVGFRRQLIMWQQRLQIAGGSECAIPAADASTTPVNARVTPLAGATDTSEPPSTASCATSAAAPDVHSVS